jgi:hypothetical protein
MNVLRREHAKCFDPAALRDVRAVTEGLVDLGTQALPADTAEPGTDAQKAAQAATGIVNRWAGVVGHFRRLDQGVD